MRFKSFRKEKEAFIKAPQEDKRKAIPWGKYVYFGILILILVIVARWGFAKLASVQGVGVLEAETTSVEGGLTARILEIRRGVNDRVSEGEPLVYLDKSEIEYEIRTRETTLEEKASSMRQKIAELEEELALLERESQIQEQAASEKKEEYRQVYDSLSLELEKERVLLEREREIQERATSELRQEYETLLDLLALEVVTRPQVLSAEAEVREAERKLALLIAKQESLASRLEAGTNPQLQRVETEFREAQRRLEILSAKQASVRTALDTLRSEYDETITRGQEELELLSGRLEESVLVAPTDGVVTLVHKQEGEVVRTGEPVLEIADVSRRFIRAYFDLADDKWVKIGELVVIRFENGDRASGIIRKIYPGSQPLPALFRREFGPQQGSLVAEIVPKAGDSWNVVLSAKAKVIIK